MFKRLRLQLTLLYATVALTLMVVVGGGGYLIVAGYLNAVTDLALQHKMTHKLHILGIPIPPELAHANRDWSTLRSEIVSFGQQADPSVPLTQAQAAEVAHAFQRNATIREIELDDEGGSLRYKVTFDDEGEIFVDAYSGRVLALGPPSAESAASGAPSAASIGTPDSASDAAFDAELATVFVLTVNTDGSVLFTSDLNAPPLSPDGAALSAALAEGHDMRTVNILAGEHVRLLTYRVDRQGGPAALQLGRVLRDQERLLDQLRAGLLLLNAFGGLLLGVGSWLLAGRALQPAQWAWERQHRFITGASHELRTPLTLIHASTEVAIRTLLPEQVDTKELLDDALLESTHMQRLIDELLTLLRMDSGELALDTQAVALPALLDDLCRQVGRLADARGVHLVLDQVDGVVQADPQRLRQVLLILLDNALRYTPAGGHITLGARAEGRTAVISVTDTGGGIAAEHLPLIFERFYQADAARGAGSGNIGLGLSIAEGLSNAMGGRIVAVSAPGRGTTMTITLPRETALRR